MNFLVDYLGFILLKAATVFLTLLPTEVALCLGRIIGVIGYHIDFNHRDTAYDNLKTAFSKEKTPCELRRITRKVYENFSLNIVELLRLPAINKDYLKRYISIEGEQYLKDALNSGKGLIFLAVHFGSWEVSNVLGAMFGYRYMVVAKEQKRFEKLSGLLTSYRQITGAFVVNKGWGTRDIIESLRRKEVVGMVADQGGKGGVFVDFFGKQASMSAGAIRMAMKLDVNILPVFLIRKKGPYHLLKIEPPLDLKTKADPEEIIHANLSKVIKDAEEVIRQHPEQYAWFYKAWKYSQERTVVILSDGKAGHLRQSEAVAMVLQEELRGRNFAPTIRAIEIRFKNNLAKIGFNLSTLFSGKYLCHGCLSCLKHFLDEDSCRKIYAAKGDFVISCGSTLAGLNLILSRESRAQSICILKPGILNSTRFNLVIVPKHDNLPLAKNIFVTSGSPNLIDAAYLEESRKALFKKLPALDSFKPKIGILIGGNTKKSILLKEELEIFLDTVKQKVGDLDAEILFTTSRRTSFELEVLIKSKLADFSRCKLLVVANEKNIPEAVGGILALSKVLIVSEDSISMVSEAASSGKNVIVWRYKPDSQLDLRDKHDRFLKELSDNKNIILATAAELPQKIEDLFKGKTSTVFLNDREIIKKAVNSVI